MIFYCNSTVLKSDKLLQIEKDDDDFNEKQVSNCGAQKLDAVFLSG
jgi:hypothetical protein